MKVTAIPLLVVSLLLAAALPAGAGDGCVVTQTGIDCSAAGYTPGGGTSSGSEGAGLPLRYLATTEAAGATGLCWYWSPTPPGFDSWDPRNDQYVLFTLWANPECPEAGATQTVITREWIEARAWEIFRSFPLSPPAPVLEPPEHGITGLPSYLSTAAPSRLSYQEVLPDGRSLEVEARVSAAIVDWGDGSPAMAHNPASLRRYPDGTARHTFVRKTCPPDYRAAHPSGPNCHPSLEAYPVQVVFRWEARYRLGGSWVDLGRLERGTTIVYDVDEVVGVLGA